MADKLFGTDGIRGIANQFPLTPDFCFKLASVLSKTVCSANKKVAIARDTRISGDMLFSSLAAGFTAQGIDVLDLGIIPTPLCTTLTPKLHVDMSIMITASHNPYRDNGLKLITPSGDKFSDEQTDLLEKELQNRKIKIDFSAEHIGSVVKYPAGLANYLQTVSSVISADSLKGLKVVLDSANGAFSHILPEIFTHFGAKTISLSDKPNGYNINENCGSQHTENMSKTVVENHYDLGIAVDGDGDRIIICDENGNRLNGDQIIAYLTTYLHKHHLLKGNGAVATVYSNLGLGKYIRSLGLEYHATPVGERHVIAKMHETGCNIGGEESGHMVLSDYSLTGDALIAAVIICRGIKEDGRKVSEIFPVFQPFPAVSHNLHFADKKIIEQIMASDDVNASIAKAKQVLADHGTVLVRKSGTEPVIRLKVEDENAATAQQCAEMILNSIKKCSLT